MKSILILALSAIFSFQTFADSTLQQRLDQRKDNANKKRPDEVKKVMDDALKELQKAGIAEASLKKDTIVPSFSIDGKDISEFYKDGKIIVSFYRGSWCPYCMMQLKEYQKYYDEILKKGGKLIVLAPDTKKEIAKTKRNHKLTFPIYSDKDNQIAKKFGLAFKLDEKLKKLYTKFGIDLKKNQGNENFELPLPGTYVINKKGQIIYAFAEADYTKRAEPSEVIKLLD
ncbi:peroxiredoxin-like family protein [Halobacteriovorax sp. GB3]|uniref:peroxiredoxin-like family protein n=1 Tax=Halobacteriovorax sp. GB3 TaxID=2719615 RepID=UPI00235EC6D9|nr:peroxiredoxin-like family protein [Halobacteriovorax sp. GB3]MDD0851796.1 peroxiredoxin-like family protein [Halobacteriovorax sp. GB3]